MAVRAEVGLKSGGEKAGLMKAAGVHLIGGCHGHRLRPAAAEQGVHGVQLAAPQDIGCGERCDAAAGARLDHTVQQCPGHALSADQGVHKEAHQYAAVLCPADRGGAAGGLVPNSSQAGQIPGGLAGHLHNGGQQILGEGTWTDGAQRAERKPGHDKIPLLTQNILLALFVPERPVSASFYRYQYNTRRRGVALQFMTIQRFSRRFATNLKIVPYNMDRERTSKSLLKWTAALRQQRVETTWECVWLCADARIWKPKPCVRGSGSTVSPAGNVWSCGR